MSDAGRVVAGRVAPASGSVGLCVVGSDAVLQQVRVRGLK